MLNKEKMMNVDAGIQAYHNNGNELIEVATKGELLEVLTLLATTALSIKDQYDVELKVVLSNITMLSLVLEAERLERMDKVS